ncbi:MAG: hypothetical protein JWQ78_1729 [Sediminibacterium sp.]|nr:hypothetical protein [Sediminibacterium sp.]
MKNSRTAAVIVILLLILWGMYAWIFSWVVPKMAAVTVPHKWNRVPLQQSREIAHGYFGEPSLANKDSTIEQWADGSKGKMYFLRIYYAPDTTAMAFSIHYRFHNALASKDYLLDSFSIRE